MKSLHEFTNSQLADGNPFFSKKKALSTLGIDDNEFWTQAKRLVKKKLIQRLYRDFYIIIPHEYAHTGTLPTLLFINPLMNYLNQEYYVGLLSAAAYYGTTNQQPMHFYVITNKQIPAIKLSRGKIVFYVNKHCKLSQTKRLIVPTGYVKISTKEQTLVDLVQYYKVSGHLSNVADIINELSEECKPRALFHVVSHAKTTILQRLGHILELVNQPTLAKVVGKELTKRKNQYILLRPESPIKEGPKLKKWKIINNDPVELS